MNREHRPTIPLTRRRRLTARASVSVLATIGLLVVCTSAHAQAAVSVFPTPGDRVATPNTQITFRGLTAADLGPITVTGSRSGVHTGVLEGDSDGLGGSFLPNKPFTDGETVTVHTELDVVGGHRGTWSFTVQDRAPDVATRPLRPVTNVRGGTWTYRSEPSLKPAAIKVTTLRRGRAPGDLFFGPQNGPYQNGVEITNANGRLVYFKPVPRGDYVTGAAAQTYEGKPALTWWQGTITESGTGSGVDEIENTSYRHIATVRAGNGLNADLHEFLLGAHDTAWITAYRPVIWNASKIKHGSSHETVFDCVVQEIDIKTGLVMFQWDSLDHVALGASYSPVARRKGVPWDYFHVNSIQPLADGTVLISSRNTSAVYDVSERTGRIRWILGGKFSTIKLGKGVRFWYQHDARLQADGELTLFDDAGAPFREAQSRGLSLHLDLAKKTATVAGQLTHSPRLLSPAEGSDERLPDGRTLVGWGQAPDLATEYDSDGKVVFDARFVGANASYRALLFPWTGTPSGRPSVAAHLYDRQVSVSASWNGTSVTHTWRILGGTTARTLKVIADDHFNGFETTMKTRRRPTYVEVQALDAKGKVLGTSAVIRTGA